LENQILGSISRQYLAAALRGAARFSVNSSSIPILRTLLINGEVDRIHVTGTNLDAYATLTKPAAISSDSFALAVPYAGVLEWLAHLKCQDITLALNHRNQVEFSAVTGRIVSRFACDSLPGDDYPVLPTPKDAQHLTVNVAQFSAAVQAVLPFCPKPSRRYWQSRTPAAFFRVEGGRLSMVACDGSRLSRQTIPLQQGEAD